MGMDNEDHVPRETFDISDPSFETVVPRRYRGGFWRRWFAVVIRSRGKPRADADEEEGDGLLYGTDAAEEEPSPTRKRKYCVQWCIYGGNTALSIL